MHRKTSAPRSPNPDVDEGESSAQQKSTVIRLHIPPRRSTRLTPPTIAKVEDITLQDTIQLSIVDLKSHHDFKAWQNVEKVNEHLVAEEIQKMVEGTKNVDVDEHVSFIPNSQNDPGTRLDPGSYKESPEVEITADVQPVNVIEEEEESAEDDYQLKRRVKGKRVEESMSTPSPTPIRSSRIHSTIISSNTEKLQVLMNQADMAKMIVDAIQNYMSGHIFHVHPTQSNQASVQEQQYQLYLTMKDDLQLQYQDDHHDDAHLEVENSAKRQKTFEHRTYVMGESSSGQANESESGPSTSGNQEQLDDFDFWMDKYATRDDELPTENVSQELVEVISKTVDEAKLRKVIDEMLRQRCTSGDEHQYYINQMQNFLKNDIVWESRKEILSLPILQKPIPVVQSCQRDPKAPPLSLVNQDLLYWKKDNSRPKKIVLSLHKFPIVIFLDDDIEERTTRWVNKCVKKFNPYARYGKPIEEVYSNSKIVQVIKTTGELGHEYKFVTEIIARRAKGSIVSITEPNYKNLNKNDIEDMYLLCINGKNSMKEKRVMGHQEIHKFCDATLKRVLEGLKNYNNDVKHGNVTLSLSKEDAQYLRLLKEEIEEWLKHHDQMRRWEM
ncbi:hypothetical protein Tco_0194634 [Tanacetum coccineum]